MTLLSSIQRSYQWLASLGANSTSFNVSGTDWALFVDWNEIAYCSLAGEHRVIALSLWISSSMKDYSVGTGSCESAPSELCFATRISVDLSLDLYVADTNNNRIQVFSDRSTAETTLVGVGGSIFTDPLNPTGVILDSGHHRIIRSNGEHWQCLAGCHYELTIVGFKHLIWSTMVAVRRMTNDDSIDSLFLNSGELFISQGETKTLGKCFDPSFQFESLGHVGDRMDLSSTSAVHDWMDSSSLFTDLFWDECVCGNPFGDICSSLRSIRIDLLSSHQWTAESESFFCDDWDELIEFFSQCSSTESNKDLHVEWDLSIVYWSSHSVFSIIKSLFIAREDLISPLLFRFLASE